MITATTGSADQRSEHDPLEPESECDHAADREQCTRPERQPAEISPGRGDEAREHHEFALGEVDRISRLVDEHEAECDQGVHQADHDPIRDQRQREGPIEFRHVPAPSG
jgi:hypothetical protein